MDAKVSVLLHTEAMQLAPFDLVEPTSGETPVVVEVPHASIFLDPESLALCAAPARCIAMDADLYVDELVANATAQGASLLCARWSRYVIDLNREENDVDPGAMVDGKAKDRPCGLLWRSTTQGQKALRAPVPREELSRRLSWIYRPYHQTLHRIVSRKLAKFGKVVLLSAHSMPTGEAYAAVVMGTLGRTTAAAGLIDLVERQARSFGWTVAHDDPYPGGATTRRMGKPDAGIHAIQLELARSLYMDETSLRKLPAGFELTRSFCSRLVAKLGDAALG